MEYENKEAKKFVQWFLLCSVIILLLTGTVTTLVVRNYRARENEAVTAMLGIVLKTMAVTQRNPDRKTLRVHAHVRAPACISEIPSERDKRSRKILQSYGISEAEPVIAGTKTMERRILLGTLGGVLLAELAAGGLFSFIRNGGAVNLRNCRITWKKSSAVIMNWHWRTTRRMN